MNFKLLISICTFLFLIFQLESCAKDAISQNETAPAVQTPVDGIRIGWDYRSMTKIAPLNGRQGYFGYARMVQLFDGRLACVYEASGNIELTLSTNYGKSWGTPQVIFVAENSIVMCVPEITELSDHSVLVACNPRPERPYSDDRRFGIKVRKSADGCQSWEKEQVIYQALSTFENGCWEPSMIQLPSGEVQLFFANEGVFTTSDEQNISMFCSFDFGKTWTNKPEVVGFRAGRRDGMPVPLLLKDKGELLVAVEDNKIGGFKPTIYREKLADNWADKTITANDRRREYAPTSPFPEATYAGAPYLERMKTGEVILSYQTNWQRSNNWEQSAMAVEIGDESGRNYNHRSFPFDIPVNKSGMWNSLRVIDGNTLVAITSTNAYSGNSTDVWMIKGHVIPEFHIPKASPIVDGQTKDVCWQHDWPYFVGHKSSKQLTASLCLDVQNLYVAAKVNGVSASQNKVEEEFSFLLDVDRKSYQAPHTGIFAFRVKTDGTVEMFEGLNGKWIKVKSGSKIKTKQNLNESLLSVEMAIPLSILPGGFGRNKTVGVNLFLQSSQSSLNPVAESITSTVQDQPFTWIRAFLP